jgi:uncharacterized protein
MRLNEFEITSITSIAKSIYSNEVSVYLFGSRTNDNLNGGDIDILIIPENGTDSEELFDKKIKFLVNLKDKIGDQKIDVVTKYHNDSRAIVVTALATGIRLC